MAKRNQKSSMIEADNDGSSSIIGKEEKRIMHRDIERQRRQEMANHYSSLRSLLPLEYLKGKRSVSDHIQEAVNYIKHLQKSIEELEMKRDEIKNLSNSSAVAAASGNSINDCNLPTSTTSSVTVLPRRGGVEILVGSGLEGEGNFLLSKVLRVLDEDGVHVSSYVSTKVNESQFHTIRAEVNDLMYVDLSVLRQKLSAVING